MLRAPFKGKMFGSVKFDFLIKAQQFFLLRNVKAKRVVEGDKKPREEFREVVSWEEFLRLRFGFGSSNCCMTARLGRRLRGEIMQECFPGWFS